MEKDNTQLPNNMTPGNSSYGLSFLVTNDELLMRIYRRAERVSKAFFLLTADIKDSNMVAHALKKSAIELVIKTKDILSPNKQGERDLFIKDIITELMSLISMSDIAVSTRIIDVQHQAIIKSQIDILISDLILSYKRDNDESVLPMSLFDISELSISDNAPHFVDSHSTPQVSSRSQLSNHAPSIYSKDQKTRSSHVETHPTIRPAIKTPFKQNTISPNKNNRQESILNAIRTKGELSIKDLVEVIKGCSEKTIQRELISLVQEGVLIKTGERRWSRYSLGK